LRHKRFIYSLGVVAFLLLLWWRYESSHQTYYQGKSVQDWALELYSAYELRGTNAPAVTFRHLGSNAVADLRSLAVARPSVTESLLLRYGSKKIPRRLRSYLFQKVHPGQSTEIRIGALRALAIIGPPARPALPEMLASVIDPDPRIRWVAAQSLPALGPEAVSALLPLTTHRDPNLRHVAVYALGEAGTNAEPATGRLIECTLDTNQTVRASSYYSLSRIGPAGLPTAVALSVTNSNSTMRDAAFRALLVLAPAGQINQGRLMNDTNSAAIRRSALISLIRGRQTNEYSRALFTSALDDENPEVRETAQLGLHWLDTGSLRRTQPRE